MYDEDLLEIPAFLRRPLPEGSTLMEEIRKSARRGAKKPKIKIARRKAADTVMLHLGDEAPRIGCGFRPVEVLSRGPKWTTVRYRCAGMSVKHKFKNAVFDRARVIGEKK
tara:strand:- start:5705 stop:6034 length:330 start_codon:yes stop_codon:yes gene_type:complete